ncbi:MAG: hypothetical protein HC841_02180 [Verrucomicrobiae bacterium]|nr:hypothetical protein [Verrucomicrobiae bacterium]
MKQFESHNYTFKGLLDRVQPPYSDCPDRGCALLYLVSLADSAIHPITDYQKARNMVPWLYDIEEQSETPEELLQTCADGFNTFFNEPLEPKTPCILTNQWSPISALLERGYEPVSLTRREKYYSAATGIWEPIQVDKAKSIADATTDEELFWAIMSEVSSIASEQRKLISLVASPGWSYEDAIGKLVEWSAEEVKRSGRLLWKRTVAG